MYLIKSTVDTSSVCSLRCGGTCLNAYYPQKISDLEYLATRSADKLFLGGMTNTLLVSDYDGIAVFSDGFKGIKVRDNEIIVGSGERLATVCNLVADVGLSGVESLCGIPGTIGGAVVNNSGAFGTEISDVIEEVTVYNFDTKQVEKLSREEIAFSYRYSNLRKNSDFIFSVKLNLFSQDKQRIFAKMQEVREKRRLTQPSKKSLGSVFRSHEGVSAGYYLDKAGLKGKRIGGMSISTLHANFIVNDGMGTAEEYEELVAFAKSAVQKEFGIKLKEEVLIIGEKERQRNGS